MTVELRWMYGCVGVCACVSVEVCRVDIGCRGEGGGYVRYFICDGLFVKHRSNGLELRYKHDPNKSHQPKICNLIDLI